MLAQPSMLQPIIALVLWTHVILAWMYATRIPAIFATKMKMDPNAVRGVQMATLPAPVRWKADNYNHLLEHPTVFYAVAVVLALVDTAGGLSMTLAWAYVGIRVVHSLVQVLINKIELRFTLFLVSSIVLLVLTLHAARLVF